MIDTLEKNQKAFTDQSKGFSSDGKTYTDVEGLTWMLKDLPFSNNCLAGGHRNVSKRLRQSSPFWNL